MSQGTLGDDLVAVASALSLAQDVSGFVFEKEFQSSDGLLVIARVKTR